jgi:hypothetical protein
MVVCYLTLWRRRGAAALAAAHQTLAPGSRLVFVEPTRGVGWGSLAQTVGRWVLKNRFGVTFHRDIPAVIRASGWQLTTVKRVSVGAPAAVMTFVVGEARRYDG